MRIYNYIKRLLVAITLIVCSSAYGNSEVRLNLTSELSFQKEQDSVLHKLYKTSDSLFNAKNYQIAFRMALKVLDEADSEADLELISKTNYLIGRIWYASKDYDKAITYFKSSLIGLKALLEKRQIISDGDDFGYDYNQNFSVIDNKFRTGNSYLRLFERSYRKDSIANQSYKDSAMFYYDDIIESNSLDKDVAVLKSKALHNLSGIFIRDSLFKKAEEYTLRSIELKKRVGDQISIAHGYNALFNVYFADKQYEKGKTALFSGLNAIKKIKGVKADELRAALNLNIAYSMYMLKDYKAYEYQEKSWDLYDKLKDSEHERDIANIYAERNFEKGMQEGIMLEEIKRQKVQRNTWVLGISSFFVIVLLVFLLNQYKLRQKNLGLELSRQELMQQQKLEKVKTESQIRILNATLDGKESERKQIAETLHDSVSALLSSANLHLQACKTQFNGNTPIEVDKSQSIINEASQKIRDLSHTLVSSILLKFGLSFAIKDIAEKFSNSELQIDHDTRYIKRYDQGFEIKLYNIIQEFINNILKHSQASYAKITLVEKNKKLHLIIEDNGQGFDKELIPEKDGLGINQIDARIQMMKGKFHIESGKGKGTKITIELPVFEKEPVSVS